MAIVNNQGYLEARGSKTSFLVKHSYDIKNSQGVVLINSISIPKHLIGRRVRFKMELVE